MIIILTPRFIGINRDGIPTIQYKVKTILRKFDTDNIEFIMERKKKAELLWIKTN